MQWKTAIHSSFQLPKPLLTLSYHSLMLADPNAYFLDDAAATINKHIPFCHSNDLLFHCKVQSFLTTTLHYNTLKPLLVIFQNDTRSASLLCQMAPLPLLSFTAQHPMQPKKLPTYNKAVSLKNLCQCDCPWSSPWWTLTTSPNHSQVHSSFTKDIC